MKKMLITGGAGFIGHHLVKRLLEEEDIELVVVDDFSVPSSRLNQVDHPRLKAYQIDVCHREGLEGFFSGGLDAVVHAAAQSHVDDSITAPQKTLQTNVMGTQVLLELSRIYGVGRFLQVSTDEVYGVPVDRPFLESDVLMPNNPYAASKAAADHLVRAYHQTYGLDVVTTRSANTFGSGQAPDKLIPKMILRALGGENLPLYGDGRQKREWIAVEDHVEALLLVLEKGRSGEIYNIPGGESLENVTVVKEILRLVDRPLSLIAHVADRLGHDRHYAIDGEKLKALGYRPKNTFLAHLEETVHWYREAYKKGLYQEL